MPRNYSNIARPVQLAVNIDDVDTVIQVSSITGYPTENFFLAIERGTAREELVYCTATSDTPASFTVIRGYGGTTAFAHNVNDGVLVEHVTSAQDHLEAGVHPLTIAERDALSTFDPVTGEGNRWTGKLIYNTDEAELQIYTGSVWRPIIPPGVVEMWAGPTPPAGWLLCDGSAISRDTYDRLFAILGETWGPGDASTTFNLPDMRGRFPFGVGGTPAQALAATGGTWNHTHTNPTTASSGTHNHAAGSLGAASGGGSALSGNLTTSAGGAHSHTNPATSTVGNHAHENPNTSTSGSHSHSFSDNFTTGFNNLTDVVAGIAPFNKAVADDNHTHSGSVSGTTSSGGSHAHSIGDTAGNGSHAHSQGATSTASTHTHTVSLSGSIAAHTHTVTGSTANGGAHTHTQGATGTANPPFAAINFIIRY